MSIGFIKLHRKLIEWEWYNDINATRLFVHLLITANYENKKWRGVDIKRGQLVTSIKNLSQATSLTIQQTRTSLNKLKLTNELTIKSTNEFTLLELVNYGAYQDKNIEDNKRITNEPTNEQQTNNKPLTTTKEAKEIKEDKEDNNIEEQFNKFWDKYDHKKSKTTALTAFKKSLKIESFENILKGLDQYINHRGANSKYWKNPTTWLNQECWNDEYKDNNNHNNFNKQDYDKGTEGFITA